MVALWRQRLTSPIRLVLLGAFVGMPLLGVAFMHAGLSVLGDSLGVVLVLGAGMIGQDVSSGVLQLLFARPVRRPGYVLSRWLGVAIAASAVALVQLGLALAMMAARGSLPGAQEILLYGTGRVLGSFGLAAVLALFSSLVPGFGDLGLFLIGQLSGGVVSMVGQMKSWPWMERMGREFLASMQPSLDLAQIVHASPMPWFPIVSYASTVTLCLALAMVAINRKELSYASG
jgi:hypothetical protein